jgi:hypothetical protein
VEFSIQGKIEDGEDVSEYADQDLGGMCGCRGVNDRGWLVSDESVLVGYGELQYVGL